MSLLDRIRSLFTSRPKEGQPSTGTLMERGGGEVAGGRDEVADRATGKEFGSPNSSLDESIRPPVN